VEQQVGRGTFESGIDQALDQRALDLLLRQQGRGIFQQMNSLQNGQVVGETTSGAWGYRVGASIALGMVHADLADPGTELEVEIYGTRCRAVVQPDQPLWDPDNERLRA